VADFIGSPPMNFLKFEGVLTVGSTTARLGSADAAMPALREAPRRQAGQREPAASLRSRRRQARAKRRAQAWLQPEQAPAVAEV
jgi:hypothetical protein